MRILLTGANGYLGKQIVDLLSDDKTIDFFATTHSMDIDKCQNNRIVCDLLDKNMVNQLRHDINPDIIIHTAAIVPKTQNDYDNKANQNLNLQMIDNLCSQFSGKFVFCSSMTVYSENQSMPVSEENVTGHSLTAYALAKRQAEFKILSYKQLTPLILRFPGLYGAGRQGGLIYNIIMHYKYNKMLTLPEKPLLWAGMNVVDVAFYCVNLARQNNKNTIVNISYDTVYSINHLIEIIADIAQSKSIQTIKYPDFQMDLTRLKNENIKFNTTFKDSIKEFYNLC